VAEARIVFDQGALADLFESPAGPVAKDLVRRGLQVERRVKELVHQHGTGRLYTRRGIVHQASAPGEPPASDTGLYGASITQALEADVQGLVEKIGTNDKRGPWLELGTRNMAPRPHLVPGLDAAR
jgi:hypothetical protein